MGNDAFFKWCRYILYNKEVIEEERYFYNNIVNEIWEIFSNYFLVIINSDVGAFWKE